MFKKIQHIIFCLCGLILVCQPSLVLADNANYRTCTTTGSCKIGEFLYEDDSSPNLTATCNFTSKYPDGTSHLTSTAMASQSDGWRSQDITTAGLPVGLYRAQMCCTVDSDLLCMDKSFIIAASTTVSAADIWNYPERSLSNFGSLVSDIWGATTRRITGTDLNSGSLATKSDVTITKEAIAADVSGLTDKVSDLNLQVARNNNLLERTVNKPIIETFIEDEEPANLSEKLRKTKQIAQQLMSNSQSIKSQLALLDSAWKQNTPTQTLSSISSVAQVLGTSTAEDPQATSTLVSQAEWLKLSWSNPIINRITDRVDSTLANSSSTTRELRAYGKTPTSQQYLKLASEDIQRLDKLIGAEGDSTDAETLYGFISQIESSMRLLSNYSEEIDDILKKLDSYPRGELQSIINNMETEVMALNQLPSLSLDALAHKTTAHPLANEENALLSLKTVISANLLLLAQQVDQPIKNIWIENGSVIFKALVTNPSSVVTQKVPIKYYLPEELTEKDIIELDEGLTVKYDAQAGSLFISGEVDLGPNKSQTFEVKTQNVWQIEAEGISSLRRQSELLFEPLKKSSYFAQGAVLKADIDVSLDRVVLLIKDSHTPEARIRDYRQALVELKSAQEKMDNLKTLASSAGSVGTVFGFVGGVQTIAVWGLVIILLAGFVFLALYLKMITQSGSQKKKLSKHQLGSQPLPQSRPATTDRQEVIVDKLFAQKNHPHEVRAHASKVKRSFALPAIVSLALFSLMSLTTLVVVLIGQKRSQQAISSPGQKSTSTINKTPDYESQSSSSDQPGDQTQVSAPTMLDDNVSVLGSTTEAESPVLITIPPFAKVVRVRGEPDLSAESVYLIWTNKKATEIAQKDDWIKIRLPNPQAETEPIIGWVWHEYVTPAGPIP